ncbi:MULTISPECIES: histidine phosphatase family protein [Actinokineospora]|uniref:Phosphoglycerate mutase n=1 Tax=Actinokineospora fastidiosa TaxID=1816 RepID=A0A918G4Q2_9PSEU|nr:MULTISPECIES: histidine phosphatase family protein [Actinokineospora]UVS76439.1 Phosphoserine phosphatase 1 [Actinokineospora sp. UTMC 2448]GGS18157.1 phosphoglycerate mutase [Actinokineospora fastidiosa]
MTRLLLVRHGETISNVNHVLDSAPPGPPLTALGRRQAEAFAERTKHEPVTAVYASTAIRAQETAAPMAVRRGLDVAVLAGVHEVQAGELEGRNDPEALAAFVEVYRGWTEGDLHRAMPGGDTGHAVLERFAADIAKLRADHPDETVALVTHGGILRLGAELLADNVGPQLANAGLIPNTGHVLLETRGDGWHCLEWTGVRL